MKARLWLVLFVLLLVLLIVAGSLTIPATHAQGPLFTLYLPIVQVPLAPSVRVLSNHLAYQTSWGSLHVVGEVENQTADPIDLVKVIVDFYDADHHLIANTYTYLDQDTLLPWDKSCFDVTLSSPPGYASYEFEPPTYWKATAKPFNLTLVDPSASYDSGDYQIIGLVRNDGAVRVNYVDLVGTIYNAAGNVVGCDWTYVNSYNLDPGQSSSFTLGFYGRDESDVTSWRVQMDGSPQ